MSFFALLDESVRDDAAAVARGILERGASARLQNPALQFMFTQAAEELSDEAAGTGPHPGRLREPVFHVVVDIVGRTVPAAGVDLVYSAFRAELDATEFVSDAPPVRKFFRLVDADGVPLPEVLVTVEHGLGATATRQSSERGEVDLSDLPGTRFTVHAPRGFRIRDGDQLRDERVIRVETGEVKTVRRRETTVRWSEDGYLDGPVSGTPLAELRLGAVDEAGAERYKIPPTVYAGWVSQLQHDLRCLGFTDCPTDGYYGLATARAVQHFQDHASYRTDRAGRTTFHDAIDGVARRATREEITRWQEERHRRHFAPLSLERMHRIIRATAGVCELDEDPYAYIGTLPESGTVYGLGKFIQQRGDLGDLFQRMRFAEPYLFGKVFGTTGRQLCFQLCAEDSTERLKSDLRGAWRQQLLAAATVPAWRYEQEALTRTRAFEPILDAAHDFGIVHDRGLAMVYRSNVLGGLEWAQAVAKAIGPRTPGMRPELHYREAHRRVEALPHLEEFEALARDLEALVKSGPVPGFDDEEEVQWW